MSRGRATVAGRFVCVGVRVRCLSARAAFLAAVVAPIVAGVSVLATPAVAALPENRVYEQVSPVFKAGYPVFGLKLGVALDGESATFSSIGAFNGSGENFALNPYVARRTARGWVSSGLFPPATGGTCAVGLDEMAPDLSRFEYVFETGSTARACAQSPTNTVWVREADGSFVQASPVLTTSSGQENAISVVGGARDLSRVVLSNFDDKPAVHFVPQGCGEGFTDEKQAGGELFEAEACALRLVGVDDQGKLISLYCPVSVGGNNGGFGAISQPGASEVFFSVAVNSRTPVGVGCPDKTANPVQLFVRVNGTTTLEVSKPLPLDCTEEPCQAAAKATPMDAVFQGASEDGSRVFFTTKQPLVNEDRDAGNDLYMATIGCPKAAGEACGSAPREVISLKQVSYDPHVGQSADVAPQVVALSPDGSRVYFVAGGDLLSEPEREALEGEGRAVPRHGAENLYAYDTSTGKPTFIVDLCSGPEQSGSVSDSQCPGDLQAGVATEVRNDSRLWTLVEREQHEAQTTPNGRFLVFSSYGQLISAGAERDADTARDVYRYDAQTGRLRRVSIGESGFHTNGNESAFDAGIPATFFRGALQEQYELGSRAVSEDGSTIVFGTSEPLSPMATNGRRDVYVWHEGRVALTSSGSATEPDGVVGITPAGRDVLFATVANLVPGDTDGLLDIYDARVGGGFPPAPAAREPCSGDACQGPLSAPAPLLGAGSASQPAGGNLPTSLMKAKQKRKTHKKQKTKRKRARRSARGTVRGRRGQ